MCCFLSFRSFLFYFVYYFCFILVYLRWLYNWHLWSYVNKYINNYWFIIIFSLVCPCLGALTFPDCMWTSKRVDMKRGMNISINVISQFWFLISHHKCTKLLCKLVKCTWRKCCIMQGTEIGFCKRASQNKHFHLAILVVWNSAMPTSWKVYLALQ
jgi:hypothetical protein